MTFIHVSLVNDVPGITDTWYLENLFISIIRCIHGKMHVLSQKRIETEGLGTSIVYSYR